MTTYVINNQSNPDNNKQKYKDTLTNKALTKEIQGHHEMPWPSQAKAIEIKEYPNQLGTSITNIRIEKPVIAQATKIWGDTGQSYQ